MTDESDQKRKMSRRWRFYEAVDRPTTNGHWYTFVTNIFVREYLVPFNGTATTGRKRREADENEEIIALANQVVDDFINSLDIGDDVEVLETELTEIKIENLDLIEERSSAIFATLCPLFFVFLILN